MEHGAMWPLALYAILAVVVVAGMLGVSALLGPRPQQNLTGEPYESGVMPTGTARFRVPVQFYLIAMFFVIFDLEAVFIFAWAIAVQEAGWLGLAEMTVFIGILLVALAYLWRIGGLDWGGRQLTASPERGRHVHAVALDERDSRRSA